MESRSKLRFISFAIFNLDGVVKTRIRIRDCFTNQEFNTAMSAFEPNVVPIFHISVPKEQSVSLMPYPCLWLHYMMTGYTW